MLFFLLISNFLYALGTSSYLISHIAFNSYDFENVFDQFDFEKNELNLNDYQIKLIALINLNKLSFANDIALKILEKDSDNQEALIVNFVYLLSKNKTNKINIYLNNNRKNINKLIDFIFLKNNELKSSGEISNSFIEIVKASFDNFPSSNEINYNLLIFYLSMSTILNSENNEAWFLTGQLYQMIEEYEKVEFFYKKISSHSSYFIDAQRNIAFNYGKLFAFEKAEKKIIDLIQISKNHPDLTKVLADFYRSNRYFKLAVKQYSELIKNKEKNLWNLLYLRGICYERLNKWNLAEKDFLSSLDFKPDSPNVLNYLAYGWIEKDENIDLSLNMLEEAYEANPNSYYILDSLAWAHYKKNNLELAAELMEKVIDMAPGEAISLDHLGDIYFSLNRKREAVFFWNQAKDLAEPEDKINENIIEKLENYYEG
ncbi:uncharacterized protein METZ01_LOCUS166071 [marine metagenome]|uniref:Uncharacterized protein n=1 Tax=marine metagenome TaxID=408172 RepID=A0A382BJ64_9ZZZZ